MLSNLCLEYCVVEQFLTVQRVLIVKTFYGNGECLMQAVQKFQTILGRNEAPCKSTVHTIDTVRNNCCSSVWQEHFCPGNFNIKTKQVVSNSCLFFIFYFYLYIYPPDLQESGRGATK